MTDELLKRLSEIKDHMTVLELRMQSRQQEFLACSLSGDSARASALRDEMHTLLDVRLDLMSEVMVASLKRPRT